MSIFKKIKEAKVSKGGNYLRPGRYFAFLRRIKEDVSRKGIPFVAVEMTILKNLDASVEDAHKIGEEVTHLMMSDKDSFLGNFKAMVANLAGVKESEIDEETAQEVVSDDQPLSGRVIEVFGRNVITRAGTPFTVVEYRRTLSPDEVSEMIDGEDLKLSLSAADIEGLGL